MCVKETELPVQNAPSQWVWSESVWMEIFGKWKYGNKWTECHHEKVRWNVCHLKLQLYSLWLWIGVNYWYIHVNVLTIEIFNIVYQNNVLESSVFNWYVIGTKT